MSLTRHTWRPWVLRLHMIAGLALSAYAFAIGISGSVMVFRDDLFRAGHPELHHGGALGNVGPDEVMRIVRSAIEGRPISLTWPNSDIPLWMSYVLVPGGAREVYVDPGTGAVAAVLDPREGWVGTVAALHTNLLAGRVGRQVNGYSAWAVLLLCLTGSVLWWPATRNWRQRFRLDLNAGWRRWSWQLHHIMSASSVLFLATLAVTGTYFIWSSDYVRMVSRFLPRTVEPKLINPGGSVLPPSRLAQLAQNAIPDRSLYRLQIVDQPTTAVRATFLEGAPAEFHLVTTVFLHPATGAVLGIHRLEDRPAGDALLSWFSALHFGVFGGWPVRILWAILGLSLPMLSVTGALMWWRRVVEPQRKKEQMAYAPVR